MLTLNIIVIFYFGRIKCGKNHGSDFTWTSHLHFPQTILINWQVIVGDPESGGRRFIWIRQNTSVDVQHVGGCKVDRCRDAHLSRMTGRASRESSWLPRAMTCIICNRTDRCSMISLVRFVVKPRRVTRDIEETLCYMIVDRSIQFIRDVLAL